MPGRRVSKKTKDPIPAFRQAIALVGMQFALAESARGGWTQAPSLRDFAPQTVVVWDEISSQHIFNLVDETSNGDETLSRKS